MADLSLTHETGQHESQAAIRPILCANLTNARPCGLVRHVQLATAWLSLELAFLERISTVSSTTWLLIRADLPAVMELWLDAYILPRAGAVRWSSLQGPRPPLQSFCECRRWPVGINVRKTPVILSFGVTNVGQG